MTDIDLDDEGQDFDEPAETEGGTSKEVRAEIARKAREVERKRREQEARDEMIREASLSAWEKERIAGAETREARLVPLKKPDPFGAGIKPQVPRVAKPKEKSARRYEPHTDALDDAETELTAIVAECRYFMRELAFESARLTPDARDRVSFIDSARMLAETSAQVGKSIASVRNPLLAEPDEKKRARR
jgi:hypothetical protein